MKEIRTEDAVGHILCHDITQIIKDEKKGVLFKKGHVVKEEDIPLLLSVGKEHLFVWEKKPGILHENEAAEILYKICAGNSSKVHGTEIKEGKIEVVSKIDGILKIRRDALVDVNSLVSMNMWGLTPDFLAVLEEGFKEFFEKEVAGNPLKSEYLIPIYIGELLEKGKMSVKVLRTNDTWYGMTYHEDVAAVKDSFKKVLENGVYKADLFSDL